MAAPAVVEPELVFLLELGTESGKGDVVLEVAVDMGVDVDELLEVGGEGRAEPDALVHDVAPAVDKQAAPTPCMICLVQREYSTKLSLNWPKFRSTGPPGLTLRLGIIHRCGSLKLQLIEPEIHVLWVAAGPNRTESRQKTRYAVDDETSRTCSVQIKSICVHCATVAFTGDMANEARARGSRKRRPICIARKSACLSWT
ncbi:hypothetical protein A0H81_01536 [Grifola frondosa]|uniref:Uncharacterized protein n=1 Tax=Grifola frondosa TaxID=5627 RepID=A0A1C7MSM2_GRIFR|nr:hypothetical protein A0H81_01536 [Grifola frondosa]